jgi:hypothetical protein
MSQAAQPSHRALHLGMYPDAVAFKKLDGPMARQLRAIALHRTDLLFCQQAVEKLLEASLQPLVEVVHHALWIAAIAQYFKCFGSSKSRGQLSAAKVFKSHPQALPVFQYFQALRDKHIVHDENAYSMSFVGFALNPRADQTKIAGVVSLALNADSSDDSHVRSFSELVRATLDWVEAKREELQSMLASEYEAMSYPQLEAMPEVSFKAPDAAQIAIPR